MVNANWIEKVESERLPGMSENAGNGGVASELREAFSVRFRALDNAVAGVARLSRRYPE